jgi:hypothetical protein
MRMAVGKICVLYCTKHQAIVQNTQICPKYADLPKIRRSAQYSQICLRITAYRLSLTRRLYMDLNYAQVRSQSLRIAHYSQVCTI